MTLLALSFKKSKMSAILGPLVYILILSIRRKAIKKIESAKSAKSAMSFFSLSLASGSYPDSPSFCISVAYLQQRSFLVAECKSLLIS